MILYSYDIRSVLFYQRDSLDETTMQIYNGPNQPSQGSIPVVTIIFPATKVEHLFDVDKK